MSVMAETSQSAIRPYVAVAAAGLSLNARTAVCREALVVKVAAGKDGEDDGGDGGRPTMLIAVSFEPLRSALARVASVKSMVEVP